MARQGGMARGSQPMKMPCRGHPDEAKDKSFDPVLVLDYCLSVHSVEWPNVCELPAGMRESRGVWTVRCSDAADSG